LLLVVLLQPIPSVAQFKFREIPGRRDPGSLNDYDERRLWSDFLYARHLGRFSLAGTLKYRPAKMASTSYDFHLTGDWGSALQVSELTLTGSGGVAYHKNIALRDGRAFIIEETDQGTRECLVGSDQLSSALVEGLPFTWNDILMPYLKWQNVTYIGPVRYLGRPAHQYLLTSEDSLSDEAKVVVTLDEDFAVMLKSDVMDKDDNVIKRIRISGFKQFDDVWMFSELVWEHRVSRESVVLTVGDFSLIP